MFVIDAFYERKSEPRSLKALRGIFAIVFIILLFAFSASTLSNIINYEPVLRVTTDNVSTIEFPDVEICGENSDLIITCIITRNNDTDIVPLPNCQPYMTFYQPDEGEDQYCGYFTHNGTLNYGDDDTDLSDVQFYWSQANLTAAMESTISVPAVSINFYDSSVNPYNGTAQLSWDAYDYQEYRNIARGSSKAAGIQGYSATLYLSKSIYKYISPSDSLSIIGLSSNNYKQISSYTVLLHEEFPLKNANIIMDNQVFVGHIQIWIGKETIETYYEERQYTILSGFGLLGGLFSILAGIYYVSFGTSRLVAWGFFHNTLFLNMMRNRFLKSNITIRGSNSFNSDYIDDDIPLVTPVEKSFVLINMERNGETIERDDLSQTLIEEKNNQRRQSTTSDLSSSNSSSITQLQQRVSALEILLKEYFIDSSFLEKLVKKD